MKKIYIIPEIEIDQINMDLTILVNSVTIDPGAGPQNPSTIDAPDLIDFGDDDVDW